MDRQLSPEEIRDLLPAYALDAVDDDERAAVDEYLERVPEARDEVTELQSAASMLAHVGGPPPAGVWERLEALITATPVPLHSVPTIGVIGIHDKQPSARGKRPWQWLAAAAAVVALAFAGLWIAQRGHDSTGTPDAAALARQAESMPGARHAVLTDAAGHTLATVVMLRDGTGYLTPELPTLSANQTYQLWGISNTKTISLGVLGQKPGVVAFKAAVPTKSLAITTEIAGGVPVSQNAPDAVGDVVTS